MSETPLERGDSGLVPAGDGWFVLNVADADWKTGVFGSYTTFERKSEDGPRTFEQMGMNVSHLAPGQPLCRYHGEENQEAFLVLKGEAVLIVEEQERQLRAWDLVHTPPWADHVIVGAGEEGCTLFAFGTRSKTDALRYPRSELALSHGAGVEQATPDADVAYADVPPDVPVQFSPGWLPGQ
jgi:uncharacterized cupin superfamily protein